MTNRELYKIYQEHLSQVKPVDFMDSFEVQDLTRINNTKYNSMAMDLIKKVSDNLLGKLTVIHEVRYLDGKLAYTLKKPLFIINKTHSDDILLAMNLDKNILFSMQDLAILGYHTQRKDNKIIWDEIYKN